MTDFLNIMGLVFDFMKDTTLLSFTLGGVEISLNALSVLVGGTAICIGIDVIHNIFGY